MRKTPKEYAEFIRQRVSATPKIGIVLGSGLGELGEKVENPIFVPYRDLPDFPVSTAPGHVGQFIFGTLGGKSVVCMQGRLHYYEGHALSDILLPVRVMRLLGVETLILTNAAGGINPSFSVGDIMLISDHINFMGVNPLVGPNDDAFGCRFPDMSFAYAPKLRELAKACAEETGTALQEGVTLPVRDRVMKPRRKFARFGRSARTRSECPPCLRLSPRTIAACRF